jgi:hypothetical protein
MSIVGAEPAANGYINRVPCKGLSSTILWFVVANIWPRGVGAHIYNLRRKWQILASKRGE